MITLDQIKDLQSRVQKLGDCIDIEGKRREVAEGEARSREGDFWNDPKQAEAFLKTLSAPKSWISSFDAARSAVDDLEVLLEL